VPIITFVNKVDREGREVFDILDEVANLLALDVTPMTWPVGIGGSFEGIYDLATNRLLLPEGNSREFLGKVIRTTGLDDPQLDAILSAENLAKLREEVELAGVGYPEFDAEAYRHGDLTPVYFGSALKEFGVDSLIEALASFAPPPRAQPAEPAPVEPTRDEVTGFVFKVQANMDPNHRDRIAFMRLCSGTFRRGMKLTPTGHGKPIAIHSPILFFARERELADEAYPGDIIGIPNHGTLRVGDTLSERADVRFTGLPNFAPEILRRVALKDPTKTKQLRKALDDMAEEGVTQVFYPDIGSNWIIGVVGQLQLDVLLSRLDAEYKVAAGLEMAPFETARWVSSENPKDLEEFMGLNRGAMAKDRDGNPVFLAKSAWEVGYIADRYSKVKFAATRER
jgi:peptide chain release factor 3